ncbi:hypothetical protein CXG81DRAFT_29326 [Caulochytrium protostelioides]|uniref:HlyIII-domain-containing protein n=1 Tax=Caulochytrium protostelioides TaxID=1555241 RepID=A0A4P9XCZ3_9FUNG|nr:hypothetical protein CXG81DRAFT_29326 [Caulochytrium protostelioides]|eukprot:RKP03323.1 hypothetical protein CXG81DRAFT_29326 [Caulochytrium protostelioides]
MSSPAIPAADDLCHSRAWYATLHFDDLSDWRRDNNAIYRGYRQIQRSYHGCTWSLFYFHNETVNVYTHLVGCLLFVGFAVALVMDHLRNIAAIDAAAPSPTGPHASGLARSLDVVITLVFLAGAIICLGLSGLFHLFCCHSREVSQAWNRCDYVGIVALIVFSYFPPVYWAFLCQPMLQLLYLGTIVVFGIGTMVAVMNARLATPAYRWLRTGLFSMLGLAGIVPVLHSTLRFGLPFTRHALGFDDLLLMGAMYLTGAVIYAARWPECIWPGRFDLVGHSHQIFHCLVVAAALVHYRCAIHLQTYWQGIVATTPGLCAIPPAQLAAQALSHPADLPS